MQNSEMRKYVFLGNFIYFSGFNNDRGLQLAFANNYNESANKYNDSKNCIFTSRYYFHFKNKLKILYSFNYVSLHEQKPYSKLSSHCKYCNSALKTLLSSMSKLPNIGTSFLKCEEQRKYICRRI